MMPGAIDRLCAWARQTRASVLKLRRSGDRPAESGSAADFLIYRLRCWPKLPSASMNTDIYRMLSVMSNRPVNRRWILNNSRLQAHQVDRLLQRLVEQDAVEVTDSARYGPDTRPA